MEIIYTKHALKRLNKRDIAENYIFRTLTDPDQKIDLPKEGLKKYLKIIKNRNVQVVAKLSTDRKKIIVVSAWVRGEEDEWPLWARIISLPFKVIWVILIKIFSRK